MKKNQANLHFKKLCHSSSESDRETREGVDIPAMFSSSSLAEFLG